MKPIRWFIYPTNARLDCIIHGVRRTHQLYLDGDREGAGEGSRSAGRGKDLAFLGINPTKKHFPGELPNSLPPLAKTSQDMINVRM